MKCEALRCSKDAELEVLLVNLCDEHWAFIADASRNRIVTKRYVLEWQYNTNGTRCLVRRYRT